MVVYAGIDEAGYGPLFGPLVVGCSAVALPVAQGDGRVPDLWTLLDRAVCRERQHAAGRLAVNDSKKLHNTQSRRPLLHLERAVLAFAALANQRPADLGAWLDALGETAHRDLDAMPWYRPCDQRPWQALPVEHTAAELAIDANMLAAAVEHAGIHVLGLRAAVTFEQPFNRMVAATRSKAAVAFACVARHLAALWREHGRHGGDVRVVVDRQSGRMRYRELIAQAIPDAHLRVLEETPQRSTYELTDHVPDADAPAHGAGRMTVRFQVEAESAHLPVALASMLSKYTRELLMARFQGWFGDHLPRVSPTAGYGSDARRFWQQVEPHLIALAIDPACLRRQS